SARLGRMPSAVGYQPSLATEMAALQERITSTKDGSITSLQAIFVPADDYTDPAPATTFGHLDSSVRLERSIVELGIYPAVDPLNSTSTVLDPRVVGEDHFAVAREVQRTLQRGRVEVMLGWAVPATPWLAVAPAWGAAAPVPHRLHSAPSPSIGEGC